MKKSAASESAMLFIVIIGIVSLFSDMTHEGARSIFGPYLELLGVSASAIGFVTGFGEFTGYSLRFITGLIANKTKAYWGMIIAGYAVNVLAIPLLFTVPRNGWLPACILIIMERAGKAIRQPAKNALLSFAGSENGVGKAFAIQEFSDQLGAFLGPVILFFVLTYDNTSGDLFASYRLCFLILMLPALCCIIAVLSAKKVFPHPENFETASEQKKTFIINASFAKYILATALLAFGFIDFPLIAMHIHKINAINDELLPLLYSEAMIADAFSALVFGWLYDKCGPKILIFSTILSCPFAIFIFMPNSINIIYIGIALWGIGMGAQESVMKSAVSSIVPAACRSMGFGIFETCFGIAWFTGSWILGNLYDFYLPAMIISSFAVQLLAVPLLLFPGRAVPEIQSDN